MLVNYSCVEGTSRALDWWLTAWLSSSMTVNKRARQRERRGGRSELVLRQMKGRINLNEEMMKKRLKRNRRNHLSSSSC